MFIQIEITPNSEVLKFIPGRNVLKLGTFEINNVEAAQSSDLALKIFSCDGVKSVMFGVGFISITKSTDFDWLHLKPFILSSIFEYYSTVNIDNSYIDFEVEKDSFVDDAKMDIINKIKSVLDDYVRPAINNDGGDVSLRSFSDGVVYINMRGACVGCPSSTLTLKNGIENILKHYIPEVREVSASD